MASRGEKVQQLQFEGEEHRPDRVLAEETGSSVADVREQHKPRADLGDLLVEKGMAAIHREPREKAAELRGASKEELAEYVMRKGESELTREEVNEYGGKIRSGTAAKAQSVVDRATADRGPGPEGGRQNLPAAAKRVHERVAEMAEKCPELQHEA